MPLAILKRQVKDLPLDFTLSDEQAMSPEMKLSKFSEVIVIARVSKSGRRGAAERRPAGPDERGQGGRDRRQRDDRVRRSIAPPMAIYAIEARSYRLGIWSHNFWVLGDETAGTRWRSSTVSP